ncbi:MAG TPA: alpha/beta hydrolase [Leptolyngbyaceae cyanobacterium]
MNTLHPIYETLTKSIVYVDNLPEFQSQVQGFLALTGYQIDRVFDDANTGFHAIGLISTTANKPPVLVFRGTDSITDDPSLGDRRGIGFNQFEANKTAISDWLTQISQNSSKNPNNLPIDLIGHSLGGALTQLAASEFTNLVGNIVTFNSPGVSAATANTFNQKVGTSQNVTHYITSGDRVSLGGEAFISGRVILQSYTDPNIDPLRPFNKHRVDGLLTNPPPGYTQQEIPIAQLNSPTFTFTNDADFAELLAAMSYALPQYLPSLTSRAGAEATRISEGFSFLGLTFLVEKSLDPSQPNYLVGNDDSNTALALDGNDTVIGNGGNDTLFGNQGEDILLGGMGNDVIYAGKQNDFLYGNQGDDFLSGDLGDDFLYGGKDNDTLVGGEGNDILSGDFGNDTLIGGNGRDQFVLAAGKGTDAIVDFQDGQDLLVLTGGLFVEQLSIIQGNNETLISVVNGGEVLARLTGIQSSSITSGDFVFG